MRSPVFHESGGFDEDFFAHQEEIDLCWRMQRSGYKIVAVPSSIVYHVGGGTLPMGNSRKVYLNFRNNLLMLSKNLSLWILRRTEPKPLISRTTIINACLTVLLQTGNPKDTVIIE